MNAKILYFTIAIIFTISCKENKASAREKEKINSKILENIPKNQLIEKREFFAFDKDQGKDMIITTTDKDASFFYEYWFKDDVLLYKFKYPWVSINYKWLIDLDKDGKKEIIRAMGYEDGVDYIIYKIIDKEQIAKLYVNPALINDLNPHEIFWAYPKDIQNVMLDDKNDLTVSLNNNYIRDDNHIIPKNQKELPFLFFRGKSTQPNFVLKNINTTQQINFSDLMMITTKRIGEPKVFEKVLITNNYDINGDGAKDKIEIYRNDKTKNKFDQEHFDLPIKIFKGTNKGFELWAENSSIIFPVDNSCISEGFSNIVLKDNFFTIESQACYNYSILVSSYTTFKVEKNQILLHKYGEEYFDKSNHEKKIPSKMWTQKDFGKIKFDEVDSNFLLKLKSR